MRNGREATTKVLMAVLALFLICSAVYDNNFNDYQKDEGIDILNSEWWENWSRDKNRNKIDDLIDEQIKNTPGSDRIPIHISYNHKPDDEDVKRLSKFDLNITYVAKYINVINVEDVRLIDIGDITIQKDVVMVSQQPKLKHMLDIATPAVKARSSSVYSPETAWQLGYTGLDINIAILDSGVDDEHESLEGKYVAGIEIRGSLEIEGNPDDTDGHGTHCAGIAMGSGGKSGGFKGTAPDAKLIDVKVSSSSPVYNGGNAIEGIEWCIDNKDEYDIRIISLS
jgi:subtilisin family serine protease